jgi:ribosomal protein S18 acetylase RimI-like enzyme
VDELITLRPIEPGDEAWLYHIYASTREEELAQVAWAPGQREAFLAMQFNAQHRYYQEIYPRADYQLILHDGQPAGRLYVNRGAAEMRIVDIALVPEYRNRGIGTRLLRELLAEADAARLPLTIHVERFNPALGLYTRLGFRQLEDKGVYLLLGWSPARGTAEG